MCVKADGTIVGKHRPLSEYPFHRAIYKIRPKMRAVIHAHPPGLVTFSVIHQIPDTSIIPQARAVCGPIGFAKYDVPGSEALGKSIAEAFKNRACVMLANDSVVVASDSLLNAFDRLEVAEFSAKSLVLASPIGELHPITDAEVEDLRVAFHVGE